MDVLDKYTQAAEKKLLAETPRGRIKLALSGEKSYIWRIPLDVFLMIWENIWENKVLEYSFLMITGIGLMVFLNWFAGLGLGLGFVSLGLALAMWIVMDYRLSSY